MDQNWFEIYYFTDQLNKNYKNVLQDLRKHSTFYTFSYFVVETICCTANNWEVRRLKKNLHCKYIQL